jgi:hypothetical protein
MSKDSAQSNKKTTDPAPTETTVNPDPFKANEVTPAPTGTDGTAATQPSTDQTPAA